MHIEFGTGIQEQYVDIPAPTPQHPFDAEVPDATAARALGTDYMTAVGKVVTSHVRNELAGAEAFDEPAIALAPGAPEKWLACRIAMEEYGHHLRFAKLGAELGLPDPRARPALSVFDYRLESWAEFVVLKALVDLAELIVMEDLATCTYLPLRRLATALTPEERFHVAFGNSHARELVADPEARPAVQRAVDGLVRASLPFFGRSVSANNDEYRRWGIKRRTNDEARAEFIERSRDFVVDDLHLSYPSVSATWAG